MDTNTDTLHADLLVIGFGKGGKTLAANMGREGKRVIMVEQSDQMYGGTCINIGCVPTKALIHQAEQRREDYRPQEWYQNAVRSTEKLTTLMREKNFQMLDVIDSVTVITGRASFIDAKTVEVTAGEDRLAISADTFVINTGAEPFVPDIPGVHTSNYVYTSTDMISTTELPRRLAIVGGGYVGLEFAGMYSHFGSEVTVLEGGPRTMPGEDDDVVTAAVDILHDQGVTLTTGARVTEVRDGEDVAVLSYEKDGQTHTMEADAVLMALGRVPATRDLGLDKAGVVTTARGAIRVDEYLRTSQRHIFAIGDVNGGPQFTYISFDDHRIVTDQLIGSGLRSTADRTVGDISTVPYTVFMTPALSRVGLTERQASESGRQVKIATKPVAQVAAMPRAKIVEETRGLMKFVVDADTDQILGAALLSVDSQELINLVAFAIKHGVTATELRDGIYTHPSSTEAFNEVLATLS
ncbi:MAG: putative pyridine nucleotide-disulfide oxidoreductase [Microbacteriaceae bacterium]|jgi:pyruvate/2-oxoglutarate dehydrogenase complex dihydrolipoamide dehydrogenase (E3) component|nr:putative pyridine nucleotide-disulfide oxidoreductase [Microbacteriaceae bacterium]